MSAAMPSYSELRKSNHFYYFIKFTLNIYSMLFSLMGLCVLCVGVYAEAERQKNRTLEGLFLAPAVVLILLGLVMFTVSVVGMVGSLRDNKTLLHMFSCCGGDEYKDWGVNQYHFCNGTGPLACGVPYTCCVRRKVGEVINTLCGYKTLNEQRETLHELIHVRGCIHAVNLWMSDNIGITVALCCAIGLPQLLGIILSCVFWNLLVDMSESADMVDFKLKKAEVEYSELDLAGAGWCMCLPRDGGYLPVPAAEPDLDPIDVHLQKLKKQAPRTHSQLRELQQSMSATGLDEVDVGRKQKREH
ncbi:tetraspanin-15 isoform X3 [Sebastes fasciatus]|uniref:tetraspanin-15 isoform X3 n=1 Tax=Sebastes fasciatus TaxID=394691 RepID=UPI003D9E970A